MTHFSNVTRCVITLHNVLDGTDEAQNSSKCANDDCLYAQNPGDNMHGPENNIYGVINKNDLIILFCFLLPPFLCIPIKQPHVEEGRKHKSEAGDKHGADQLEDGAEAGQGLGKEEEHQHHAASKHHPFPVECRLNAKHALKELVRRIKKHWIGRDKMDQQQDLHGKLDGAVTQDASYA